jgi:hypothetical protein
MSVIERLLGAFVLFYGGLVFCLPVAASEEVAALYPWWAKRVALGNVQLHELAFFAWFALYGASFVLRALLKSGTPTRQAAIWLIALAFWCGLISLTAPLPWQDLGRTFRLMLNAGLLLAIVRWTQRSGEMPLTMLILGFFTGTVINLVISFQYPLVVYGTMRLSGQNTPGVAMGIAVHLTAWLFFRGGNLRSQLFSIFTTPAFVFGCAISFSRIGWFAGGLGLTLWFYILIMAQPLDPAVRRRLKKVRLVLVPVLAGGLASLITSPLGHEGLRWMQTLAQQKTEFQEESDSTRLAYVTGTAEILSKYPLGVGYSGFFDAMTATDIYRSGQANREDSLEANPHASFLWYATAGGVPGGAMALLVFAMLLNSMRWGLVRAMGWPGWMLFVLAAAPFLLIGMTVPYLLNSSILIAPVAIAAGWGWTWRAASARRADSRSTASSVALAG